MLSILQWEDEICSRVTRDALNAFPKTVSANHRDRACDDPVCEHANQQVPQDDRTGTPQAFYPAMLFVGLSKLLIEKKQIKKTDASNLNHHVEILPTIT